MKRIISTVGLSRADWLRTRRQGITGVRVLGSFIQSS